MPAEKTLDDLTDIYHAENQIVKTLPRMAKAAQSAELKAGLEQHLVETEGRVERIYTAQPVKHYAVARYGTR